MPDGTSHFSCVQAVDADGRPVLYIHVLPTAQKAQRTFLVYAHPVDGFSFHDGSQGNHIPLLARNDSKVTAAGIAAQIDQYLSPDPSFMALNVTDGEEEMLAFHLVSLATRQQSEKFIFEPMNNAGSIAMLTVTIIPGDGRKAEQVQLEYALATGFTLVEKNGSRRALEDSEISRGNAMTAAINLLRWVTGEKKLLSVETSDWRPTVEAIRDHLAPLRGLFGTNASPITYQAIE